MEGLFKKSIFIRIQTDQYNVNLFFFVSSIHGLYFYTNETWVMCEQWEYEHIIMILPGGCSSSDTAAAYEQHIHHIVKHFVNILGPALVFCQREQR